MPRNPKFQVKNTPKGWLLNIPKRLSSTGEKQRRYFKTKAEAVTESGKLRENVKEFGVGAKTLTAQQAGDAAAALDILTPFGITLLEAAKRIVASEVANAESRTIEEALLAFLTTKENSAEGHFKAYENARDALINDFAGRMMASITGEEVVAHLERSTGTASAHNLRARLVKAFWRWCAKPPRKWCRTDAVNQIEIKETMSDGVGTLTSAEAEKLLRTAQEFYPDMVPTFAIALFTGTRKEEIQRIEASEITAEGIVIPASKSKTKRRRFIQMSEPLAAWLEAYPIGEAVAPGNFDRKETAVRRLAGWAVWAELVKDSSGDPIPVPDDLPAWPSNALRHTAASVALAIGKPIETLVFEHGHSGGLTTLQRHYIGVMPKAEALKIWALRP